MKGVHVVDDAGLVRLISVQLIQVIEDVQGHEFNGWRVHHHAPVVGSSIKFSGTKN